MTILAILLVCSWMTSGAFVAAVTSGYIKKFNFFKYLAISIGWPIWISYIIYKK